MKTILLAVAIVVGAAAAATVSPAPAPAQDFSIRFGSGNHCGRTQGGPLDHPMIVGR